MLEKWLDAPHRCNISVRIVPQVDTEDGSGLEESSGAVVVYSPSQLLSKIPYFACNLSGPWQTPAPLRLLEGTDNQEVIVRCPALSSPFDVYLCLRFLQGTDEEEGEGLQENWTVDLVLRVLSAASYLGYEECQAVCMNYLAAAVWSSEEKVAVKKTLAALSIKPSVDVLAKLQPIKDIQRVLKGMLVAHVDQYGSDATENFVKAVCALSPDVARPCLSALNELWVFATQEIIKTQNVQNIMFTKYWKTYTKVILLHGDVGKVLKELVERCEKFSDALIEAMKKARADAYASYRSISDVEVFMSEVIEGVSSCLAELLERAVPNKGNARASIYVQCGRSSLLLSNEERAMLSKAFSRFNLHRCKKNDRLFCAVENITLSLPLQDEDYLTLKERGYNISSLVWRQRFFTDLSTD
ncbi:hypothetical protein L7F22_010102 [Adiantum nelumboides]|nr:hypothetical protein [Adiantum nelumboides]